MDPDEYLPKYDSGHHYDTAGEMLSDNALWAYNRDLMDEHIEPGIDKLKRELGLDESDFVRLPALFESSRMCGGLALAHSPLPPTCRSTPTTTASTPICSSPTPSFAATAHPHRATRSCRTSRKPCCRPTSTPSGPMTGTSTTWAGAKCTAAPTPCAPLSASGGSTPATSWRTEPMRMSLIIPAALLALSLIGASTVQAGVALESLDARWARTAVAGAAALEAQNPELANAIRTAQPRLSRSGVPLFIDPTWYTPDAASAILVRIAEGDDTPGQSASPSSMPSPGTGGTHGFRRVAALLALETDASVRRMMVELMRCADRHRPLGGRDRAQRQGARSPVRRAARHRLYKPAATWLPWPYHPCPTSRLPSRLRRCPLPWVRRLPTDSSRFGPCLPTPMPKVRFRALRSLEKLDTRAQQLTELDQLASTPT